MKAAVLADMAMGIQRSADAEEGIREQRMANAPSAFPTESEARKVNSRYVQRLGEDFYEANPGTIERPRFIVGVLNQENIDERMPADAAIQNGYYTFFNNVMNTGTNFQDEAIKRLKPGQALLVVNSQREYEGYVDPRYLVVAKDENGRVYQREIDESLFNDYQDAMRSGLPVSVEGQLKIDDVASRSMMPRVRQDEVIDLLPMYARLKQLTYVTPETANRGYGTEGMAGFVDENAPYGVTIIDEYIPKDKAVPRYLFPNDTFLNKLLNKVLPFGSMNKNPYDAWGQYVLGHEQAHVLDNTAKLGIIRGVSGSQEYQNAARDDMAPSSKFSETFAPDENLVNTPNLGNLYITDYAEVSSSEDGFVEDLAERYALYEHDKRYGGIGTSNGKRIRYADVYPNTAKFFNSFLERPR